MTIREDGVAARACSCRRWMMVMASMASATHPRPKGATPLRVSLVLRTTRVRSEPDPRAASGVPVV